MGEERHTDCFSKIPKREGTISPASFHEYVPISHTCLLPCLPSGGTLLFWSDLFVVGRVVSWEMWDSTELGRWESKEALKAFIKSFEAA